MQDAHDEAMKAADELRRVVVQLSNRSVIILAELARALLALDGERRRSGNREETATRRDEHADHFVEERVGLLRLRLRDDLQGRGLTEPIFDRGSLGDARPNAPHGGANAGFVELSFALESRDQVADLARTLEPEPLREIKIVDARLLVGADAERPTVDVDGPRDRGAAHRTVPVVALAAVARAAIAAATCSGSESPSTFGGGGITIGYFVRSTAASTTRTGDVPELRRRVSDLCRVAAHATGRSLQAIHGYVRATWTTTSIHRIPIAVWPYVERNLQRIALREVPLPPPRRAAPLRLLQGGAASAPTQTAFPFASEKTT